MDGQSIQNRDFCSNRKLRIPYTDMLHVCNIYLHFAKKVWQIHPGRLTWTIIMEVWKIIFLSKWVICRFHVNLPGCIGKYSIHGGSIWDILDHPQDGRWFVTRESIEMAHGGPARCPFNVDKTRPLYMFKLKFKLTFSCFKQTHRIHGTMVYVPPFGWFWWFSCRYLVTIPYMNHMGVS